MSCSLAHVRVSYIQSFCKSFNHYLTPVNRHFISTLFSCKKPSCLCFIYMFHLSRSLSFLSLEEKAVMGGLGRFQCRTWVSLKQFCMGRVPYSQPSCRDAGSTRRWMKGLTENDWAWQGKDKRQTEGSRSQTESKAGETSFSGLKEQPQFGCTVTSQRVSA